MESDNTPEDTVLVGRVTLDLLAGTDGMHVTIEEDGQHDMTPLEMLGVLEMAKGVIYYDMFLSDFDEEDQDQDQP